MPLSLARLRKIVSEVDGRLPAQAMDKLQGPIAAWLRKLSPSETLSERTFEQCVSPSPPGEKSASWRAQGWAGENVDRRNRPCTPRRSQVTTIPLFHGNRRSAQ